MQMPQAMEDRRDEVDQPSSTASITGEKADTNMDTPSSSDASNEPVQPKRLQGIRLVLVEFW